MPSWLQFLLPPFPVFSSGHLRVSNCLGGKRQFAFASMIFPLLLSFPKGMGQAWPTRNTHQTAEGEKPFGCH
jgi:hypothetical protein